MRSFRDSLRRHRAIISTFIAMSFAAMVDVGNYVYAYQLHDQERTQYQQEFTDLFMILGSTQLFILT